MGKTCLIFHLIILVYFKITFVAIEKEIENKKLMIEQLEASNSRLDEDTRRAHKQFTINRDNCERYGWMDMFVM